MTKFLSLVVCSAALLSAADFKTGQAARAMIGQDSFTKQQSGAGQKLIGANSGIAYANDTLFVVDSNRVDAAPQNNRVLIYNHLSSMLPAPDAEIPPYSGRCPLCLAQASNVLGQPNFTYSGINGTTGTDSAGNPTGLTTAISDKGLRVPTGVATDGQILAVADTSNNRVLIWKSIPTSIQAPADVVLGQADFNSNIANWGGTISNPSAKSLRSPQGVWISQGKFYVADTQNNRILVWNSIPAQNGQAADLVVGQATFDAFVQTNIAQGAVDSTASNMLNPTGVTTDPDGRLFVADLGYNRVLIWNRLPTQNGQAADVVLGQPDMTSSLPNTSAKLCDSNGTDSNGALTYPGRCAATMNYPRFALSDGTKLFVADSGNDRVLIWNRVPLLSGKRADVILGQKDEFSIVEQEVNILGVATFNPDMVSAAAIRTPMSLAWDGTNLYVSDPYNRRVVVYSQGEDRITAGGVRNAASIQVFAVGYITFGGKTDKEGEVVTVTIGPTGSTKDYTYKVVKDDTFNQVITSLVNSINAGSGDPYVLATPNLSFQTIILTARTAGPDGNKVTYTASVAPATSGAVIDLTVSTSGSSLAGGQDAAKVAPGSLVTLLGQNFTTRTESAPVDADPLPRTLGGLEVYFDGIPAPLLYVSPSQINAQVPWDINDATSISAYVRTTTDNGVSTSVPVAVSILPQNPGIFAEPGADPRTAYALHESDAASGAISVDGSIKAGDVGTVVIEDREYSYTVKADDTLAVVRDALVASVNQDPKVTASAAGVFTRIRLTARVQGPEGEGIKYSAKVSTSASLTLSALSSALCCASEALGPVNEDNPLIPGETFVIFATGMGLVNPTAAQNAAHTGEKYKYTGLNRVNEQVDSLAGGKTANVFEAGLQPGTVGIYRVVLQLNPDLPTNPKTQLTIAQNIYVSNIVTIPVRNPNN